MNANEFRVFLRQPLRLSREEQHNLLHRILGWLSADVTESKGENRLRDMIADEIRKVEKHEDEPTEDRLSYWDQCRELEARREDQAYDDHVARESEP